MTKLMLFFVAVLFCSSYIEAECTSKDIICGPNERPIESFVRGKRVCQCECVNGFTGNNCQG